MGTATETITTDRALTGIRGLDYILRGGLPKNRIYLVHGGPGAGKTTLGFQFLLEGARLGERVLYITLLQTRKELQDIFLSHGWPFAAVTIAELPANVQDAFTSEQTVFSTADVELNEATDTILRIVDEHKPQRLVLDSVSELSVLVDNSYQLRRHLLKLKQELSGRDCTSVFTSGDVAGEDLLNVETLVHGVIALQQNTADYGHPMRRLQVSKMRGMEYAGGYHDFRIRVGGLQVFPQLHVGGRTAISQWTKVGSGIVELDTMLGGGLEEGTACLVTGTTGAGKSTLGALYVQAAAARGSRCAIFCFDERRDTFLRRADGLALKISSQVTEGVVDLQQIDIGDISPGEFMQNVRRAVDRDGAKVVVIDSLTGYLSAFPKERDYMSKLHELLSYLSSAGVLTILVVATHGFSQAGLSSVSIDTSYMADTVIVMRHFEACGEVRRCISVLKKRHGQHETTIREVEMGPGGLRIGPPITEFTGVLSGQPQFEGSTKHLMGKRSSDELRAP